MSLQCQCSWDTFAFISSNRTRWAYLLARLMVSRLVSKSLYFSLQSWVLLTACKRLTLIRYSSLLMHPTSNPTHHSLPTLLPLPGISIITSSLFKSGTRAPSDSTASLTLHNYGPPKFCNIDSIISELRETENFPTLVHTVKMYTMACTGLKPKAERSPVWGAVVSCYHGLPRVGLREPEDGVRS